MTVIVTRLDVGFEFELVVILAFISTIELAVVLTAKLDSEFMTGSTIEFTLKRSLILFAKLLPKNFLTCLSKTLVVAASVLSVGP